MARQRPGTAEHHAPGNVGDASPEFTVDEVAQASRGKADRHQRRDEIHQVPPVDALAPGDEGHGREHAEKSAVERHAALPDGEDLERVIEVVTGLVEQHVAQAPAQDYAHDAAKEQVVQLFARDGRQARLDAARAEPPERAEGEQVHEPVPAHRQRADGEHDGVEVRMCQHDSSPRLAWNGASSSPRWRQAPRVLHELARQPDVQAALYVRGATALVQGPKGATAERTARTVQTILSASRSAARRLGLGQVFQVQLEGPFGTLSIAPGEQDAGAILCSGPLGRAREEALLGMAGMNAATSGEGDSK